MNTEDFDELLGSVRTMVDHINGKPVKGVTRRKVPRAEVSAPAHIRGKIKLTQAEFAVLLGVSLRTLQDWETGRRNPAGPARSLLKLAAARPDLVISILGGFASRSSQKPSAKADRGGLLDKPLKPKRATVRRAVPNLR